MTSTSPASLFTAVNVMREAVFAAVEVAFVDESFTITASVIAPLVATPVFQVVLYSTSQPRPEPRLLTTGKEVWKARLDAVIYVTRAEPAPALLTAVVP